MEKYFIVIGSTSYLSNDSEIEYSMWNLKVFLNKKYAEAFIEKLKIECEICRKLHNKNAREFFDKYFKQQNNDFKYIEYIKKCFSEVPTVGTLDFEFNFEIEELN